MKGKIRIRKTEEGMVYVVKTEKFISETEVEEIKERLLKAKEAKKMKKKAAKLLKKAEKKEES